VNDVANRLSRRSTLAVVGAASAVGLASVGRLAAAGSQPSRPSDDPLVIDDKGRVGIGKTPDPDDIALLDVGGKIKSLELNIRNNALVVETNGKVGIGKAPDPGASLDVGGKIKSLELNIRNNALVVDASGNVGIGTAAAPTARLEVIGALKCNSLDVKGGGGTMTGTLTLTVPKETSPALAISANGYLAFGAGLDPKQTHAGKVGYKLFTDGLDFVGAGEKEDLSDRKITMHTQGGMSVNGPILMDGFLNRRNEEQKEPKKETMRAKVKQILEPAPVGTFILYLTSDYGDPNIAYKDSAGKLWTARLFRAGVSENL
jgi:hypothetical protein